MFTKFMKPATISLVSGGIGGKPVVRSPPSLYTNPEPFPAEGEPMKNRVKQIYRNLDRNVDVVVIANSTDPHIDATFYYATGITTGLFEGCAAFLHPDGHVDLLASQLEEETAKKAGLPITAFMTKRQLMRGLRKHLEGHRRIGLNFEEITHNYYDRLRKLAPKARFINVSEAVRAARSVKDEHEQELIEKACKIASDAFEDLIPRIKKGKREDELAAELVYLMQKHGAGGASFETIVASGPNGAEPHYTAGTKRLQKGELVVFDFGAKYHKYVSDITRTVVVGRASERQKRMHSVVERAQKAALAKMRKGVKGAAVDKAARDLIEKTEFKGRFIHSLGHSIGLAVHDGAGLGPASKVVLKPGMIFTNEPGVYISGYGGVRIEDNVLITSGKPRTLTTATRELIEV
jgi:Xaa-Pro dipeptidase